MSCWQAANPGGPLAQTLRWSANREAPYHCDGIFVPSAVGARLVACRVVRGSALGGAERPQPGAGGVLGLAAPRRALASSACVVR